MPDALLTLRGLRRMLEGVIPPAMCSMSPDGMPHVNYLSLAEYIDDEHVALSFQFFNQSRRNALATRRVCVALDDPYSGAGVVMQLEYQRTETAGPVFERLRARLAGVAAHVGMEDVFVLRGADIYRVLELRRVPGRRELPGAQPRCDVAGGARRLSEAMAGCSELDALIDTLLRGLREQLLIEHAMLWLVDPGLTTMTLLAASGYPQQATGVELALGDGLAAMAAREGVPIRIGHIANMRIYGQAVRERAYQDGSGPMPRDEIALPGLDEPCSQLAVPLRAAGRTLGVLFVESEHDQFLGYDDEDALMLLAGQLAGALSLLGAAGHRVPQPPPARAPAPVQARPLQVRYYPSDGSVFLDDDYLIKGVAGAIFWKLARQVVETGRDEFSTRELRLAAAELRLPDVQDNLDVRLLLLQRRLAEREADARIERTGRGRYRLNLCRPLALQSMAEAAATAST